MADATYKLIGVVRGNATTMTKATDASPEGRAKAEVQIEDVNGLKVTWGTFHVSIAKDLQLGKWYEFEVATPARKEGQGVWHNLESVICGPIDKPAPGTTGHQEAEAATGPAHTVKSDQQFKIERTSLQRQGAMGIVLRLMEVGISLDKMEETITEVLKHAETIETFYERPIAEQEAPKQKRSRKAPEEAKQPELEAPAPAAAGAPSTNGHESKVPEFAHLGALLTWFTGAFKGKTSHDLCDLVGAKDPASIDDWGAAARAAQEKWGTAA
jgi:hypothetical protein